MKNIKKTAVRGLILLMLTTTSHTFATTNASWHFSSQTINSPTATIPTVATSLKWLFVLHANHARIEKQNGQLYLRLVNVSEDGVALTDRPTRQYKTFKTNQFIAAWNRVFTQKSGGNPNSVVTHSELTTMTGGILPEGIVLENPVTVNRNISFRIAYLDPKIHYFVLGKTYSDINLFIDTSLFACGFLGKCPW